MADELPQELANSLNEPRRAFLRKLILGTAFVVPAVASFTMSGLGFDEAQAHTGNQRGAFPPLPPLPPLFPSPGLPPFPPPLPPLF